MTNAIQSEVTSAFVSIALALLSAILAFGVQYVKQHVSTKRIATGVGIARIVVRAAEQIGATYGFNGKAKFSEAIERARDIAASAGVSFNDDQWQTFIEHAVAELNGAYASLLPAVAEPTFQTGTTEQPAPEHQHPLDASADDTGNPHDHTAALQAAQPPPAPTPTPQPQPAPPPAPEPEPEPETALFYTSGPNAGQRVV